MSFYRVSLVAFATLLTVGMTSLASAGCCGGWSGWGATAPITYGWGTGCGGCGVAAYAYAPAITYAPPVTYGWSGCGVCSTPTAASVFAQPVAPAPIVVSTPPVGCCTARTSLYVADQGPDFTGPGLMIPYGTYTPARAYAPAVNYPYIHGYYGGYRYGYYHRFYRGYGPHVWVRPHYYGPAARYYAPP